MPWFAENKMRDIINVAMNHNARAITESATIVHANITVRNLAYVHVEPLRITVDSSTAISLEALMESKWK